MPRYIDADKHLDELDRQICSDCIDEDIHCGSCGVGRARAIAKEAPTADVVPRSEDTVEVVRCRDCYYALFCTSSLTWTCHRGWHPMDVGEGDYCSRGRRGEDDAG